MLTRAIGYQKYLKYHYDTFLNGIIISAVLENTMIDTDILDLGAIGEELGGLAGILDLDISRSQQVFSIFSWLKVLYLWI